MSCGEPFCFLGYVNLVRAPIRIYLSIRAHNKFEMPDLFMELNLYSKPIIRPSVRNPSKL
jgi:hypothetical protein